MSVLRNFEYYKEEIELALIQNAGVEIELYSIVASMIRESPNTSPLSIRDVSARRKSDISMKFYGQAGFPDFVVLAREKDSNAKLYGCIEVKMPTVSLDGNDEQLNGHIQSFKKVLYTNGNRWIFFENDIKNVLFDIELGDINKSQILWKSQKYWDDLLRCMAQIKWDL